MKKKIKVFLIVMGVIVVALIGLVAVIVVRDLKQEEVLKQEIINFSNKNLESGDFTINVKTTGDYAYVEEAIKKYYKSLSDNVKAINVYFTDEEFTNLLKPSNLAKDKPSYKTSHEKIKTTKENVNKHLKEIDSLCDVKTIENLIDKDKLSDYDYYFDFYMQLMYTDKDKEELDQVREQMRTLTNKINEFLDKAEEILQFLEKNDSVVSYANGRIYLSSVGALTEYNKLIMELQNISKSFLTITNNDVNRDNQSSSRNLDEA